MNFQNIFIAATLLLFTACSDELQHLDNQSGDGNTTPLSINVIATPTKTQITGTSLPDKSKIGVFVTKPDGSDYLPENSYNNIKYTGSGEIYATTWTVDSNTPVYLNTDKAAAYAYYPYMTSDISLNAIPITNDGTDWMYSAPVTNLNCQNATARFDLQHAMSIIRIRIDRLSESDYGNVSSLTLDGTGWATGATLNLKESKVESFTGVGSQLVKNDVGDLSAAPLNIEHWVVPTGTSTDITFRVILDGKLYKSILSDVTFEAGRVYNYKLTISNTDNLEINAVAMSDWIDLAEVDVDSEYKTILTWDEARMIDGVYGMLADGRAMVYEEATTTSESLSGVAFVVNGKAYQVAKAEAKGYEGADSVYWQKGNYANIPELKDYITSDGSNTVGYLPKSNGSYHNTPYLDGNWALWLSYSSTSALSDFNGKENTDIILAAQGGGTLDYTIGKAVIDFRNNSALNEDLIDWFIPSCGELSFMVLKKDELNNLLNIALGSPLYAGGHWTSTEHEWGTITYVVYFTSNLVDTLLKNSLRRLRLIRKI